MKLLLLLIFLPTIAFGAVPEPDCTDYTTIPSITNITDGGVAIPAYPCGAASSDTYVDSECVVCGDGTEGSPYELLSDLDAGFWTAVQNSINAGTKKKIKLKRGSTWTTKLIIDATGTSTLVNIKVENYGAGNLPIINADTVDYGVHIDGNDYIVIDGVNIINAETSGIHVEGEVTGVSVTNCEIEGGAAKGVTVYGLEGAEIEDFTMSGCVIDNNLTELTGDGLQTSFVNNSLITSNKIGFNTSGSRINGRFGINLSNSIGNTVEKNLIYQSGFSGVHVSGAAAASNIIRYNYIYKSNSRVGANYGGISTVSDGGSNEFYGNIIILTNQGLVLRGSTSGVVYNNTFYNIVNSTILSNLSSANIIIKNNLTWSDANRTWVDLTAGAFAGFVLNNNSYWTTNTLPEGDRWRVDTLKNWSEWQALPQDAAGAVGDTLFVDAPTDFWVGVGSSAIGLAADLSAEDTNYDNRIVQGSTFGVGSNLTVTSDKTTAGAYEYIAP